MTKPKVLCVVGTRPEAIKMAPVVQELRRRQGLTTRILATGQHRQLLDGALGVFGLSADSDLNVMQVGQTLETVTAKLLTGIGQVLRDERPDLVVAQGDTTTVLVSALACFYQQIPFAHVEAGLRTADVSSPFPEEFNRRAVSLTASLHFAPTKMAADNLLAEGVPAASVHLTGNTVIDALLSVPVREERGAHSLRRILLTCHRRENFGAPLEGIFGAVRDLASRNPNVEVVFPVHPNPNVKSLAQAKLGGHDRIRLIEPLEYVDFVNLMRSSYLILTDSGGVQEEAPALHVPVLVLREETERPEAVALGVARLVGVDPAEIIEEAERLLNDPAAYAEMSHGGSPYGDGHSAERIGDIVEAFLASRVTLN